MKRAEIISIGDEILIGQITNTNAQWMAQQLNMAGIEVSRLITVGDERQQMLDILKESTSRAEIVLITGGLGPTSDDLTKPVLCEFLNCKLIFREDIYEDVKFQFQSRNIPMPAVNRGQAEIPERCRPIKNKNGTAPGMIFENVSNKCQLLVSLPGVPYEMKAMMEESVLPEIHRRFSGEHILHVTIHTQGIGESTLAEKIKDWEADVTADQIKLAYLPSPGQVRLRLSMKGKELITMQSLIKDKIRQLRIILKEAIFAVEEYGKEPETLEKTIGDLLRIKKMTVAVAESCTGGFIGHKITSVAGSSDYFNGGVLAYSNEVKRTILHVDPEILKNKGAVSQETAEQMALGVKKATGADFGLSTTGIAGPGGGNPDKPVGLVWIALAGPNGLLLSERHLFGNNRERNIQRAALAALSLLRKAVQDQL